LERGEELSQGTHTFPFVWTLPAGIPSSFIETNVSVGSLGVVIGSGSGVVPKSIPTEKSYIGYSATVVVETEDTSKNIYQTANFRVAERFDPLIKRPAIRIEAEKSFFFVSKTLKVSMLIPNGGVGFPGYRLPLRFEIVNQTTKKLESLKLTFQCKLFLHAKGEIFLRKFTAFAGVVNLSEDQPSAEGKIMKDALVDIPPNIDPSILNSSLVRREYEIDVEVNTSMTIGSMTFTIQGINLFWPDPTDPSTLKNYSRNDSFLPGMILPKSEGNPAVPPENITKTTKPEEKRVKSGEWSEVNL